MDKKLDSLEIYAPYQTQIMVKNSEKVNVGPRGFHEIYMFEWGPYYKYIEMMNSKHKPYRTS